MFLARSFYFSSWNDTELCDYNRKAAYNFKKRPQMTTMFISRSRSTFVWCQISGNGSNLWP